MKILKIMARIFKISRFRDNTDGAGISTLVGLWGCPLQCRYCQNNICHDTRYSVEIGVDELADIIIKDRIYYLASGGGIVFGGGEPLLQAEFVSEVIKQIKEEGIAFRIETSLYVAWDRINLLIDDIDEWIIDIKTLDPKIFKEYTKQDDYELIINNLSRLIDVLGSDKVHIRVPVIPKIKSADIARYEAEEIESRFGIKPEVFTYNLT